MVVRFFGVTAQLIDLQLDLVLMPAKKQIKIILFFSQVYGRLYVLKR